MQVHILLLHTTEACQLRSVMEIVELIELVGELVDGAGVALIVIGLLVTSGQYVLRLRQNAAQAYQRYRQGLGRTLLLGLEFLVAADIIRTVAITPTFSSVAILAIIVLIRTFLSWTLELELEGRWPWQRHSDARPDTPPFGDDER
jgi:uncharacterized membrane protein